MTAKQDTKAKEAPSKTNSGELLSSYACVRGFNRRNSGVGRRTNCLICSGMKAYSAGTKAFFAISEEGISQFTVTVFS